MKTSVDFYENILGLKKTYEHPIWTSFDLGGISLALAVSGTKNNEESLDICKSCSFCVLRFAAAKMNYDKKNPTATSVIYLETNNLEDDFKLLKEKGVKFITEPKEQEWGGKTTVFLDPDNNILVLTKQ
jgi:uncharacterized glyoxalase superfamily protein PhnB